MDPPPIRHAADEAGCPTPIVRVLLQDGSAKEGRLDIVSAEAVVPALLEDLGLHRANGDRRSKLARQSQHGLRLAY